MGAFPIFCKPGRQKTAEEYGSAGILPPTMQAKCLRYPFKLWVYKKSGMFSTQFPRVFHQEPLVLKGSTISYYIFEDPPL
ncbi:MAG: hypothetical protein DCC43_11510 [Candidatus Brocadia sp.]|nr:hypothetical protein [Candidatus Brocadia sp. AMX3]RIJ95590.1 MAG: hypothetical protein DCC43_11510 [Candidatus Brocadia sp.]